MTAGGGAFVLKVGAARSIAEKGGCGRIDVGRDAVYVTKNSDGTYAVEPAGLWPDEELIELVSDLLARFG